MNAVTTINEAARTIPVVGKYDVLVIGGGIAGVAAAIAATRNSASVCLVERYCGLGGLATIGNVTMWLPLCDGMGNQVVGGLGEELLRLSVADLGQEYPSAGFRGIPACWQPGGNQADRATHRYQAKFNPSSYMLALEQLAVESGVHLMYDTRFCHVCRDGDLITHVILENKDGRCALAGRTIIDATGDADVCHLAGEQTISLDTNVLCGWFYTLASGQLQLHKFTNRYCPQAGRDNAAGPLFRGDSSEQVTQHILLTRALIRECLAEMRRERSDEDVQLLIPALTACFRMTRRLVGQATLYGSQAHRWFDDVIGLTGDWRKTGPVFAIPFGAIRAVKTANLLAVGRCMSVDNSAWDVLRAIPPCVVTGQAAGTAAAIACNQTDGRTDIVAYNELRTRLIEQGVLLDRALVFEDRIGK